MNTPLDRLNADRFRIDREKYFQINEADFSENHLYEMPILRQDWVDTAQNYQAYWAAIEIETRDERLKHVRVYSQVRK